MAAGTPFHPRTSELCKSLDWGQWSGYYSPRSYNDFVQPEYASIRNSTAIIDVSPLYKYWVEGRDAAALMDRLVTQHASALAVGRVSYTPWCDSDGKVRQEGTIFRLGDDCYQICAAEPALRWLKDVALGFNVRVLDRSAEVAALSLQGPNSCAILDHVSSADMDCLRFFGLVETQIGGVGLTISRTGYTGDLGYEIWLPAAGALRVWDVLMEGGARWQIRACGMLAMDISRIEAGFILIGIDYMSSEVALIDDQKASPYELGLGWAVKLDKPAFVGREALQREAREKSRRSIVGLLLDWEPLEAAYLAANLMPELPMTVCREPVPVYSREDGQQVGRVTSRVWSKLLKKYIAIATVDRGYVSIGTHLDMEVTVHYQRCRVEATVAKLPFFRPERMRA